MPVKFNNLWFRVILNFENLYSYNVSSTKSRRRKRRKARLALIFGKVNRAEVSIFPSTICLTTFSRFFLQLLQTEMAENYERVIVLRGGGGGGGVNNFARKPRVRSRLDRPGPSYSDH